MLDKIVDVLRAVKEKTPLVQAITNYVTINDCANILLCMGASPAMCEAREEVEEFVGLASSLYINVGTLTKEQEEAAVLAVKRASELNKPIVLDPVAFGAISRKAGVIRKMREVGTFSVIKGNLGEIKSMAGFAGQMRGVDSVDEGEGAVEACKALAKDYGCVVAATGKTDIITDGERTCLIENGTSMLTLVTGAGCMAGALAAGAAGAGSDLFVSTAAAILLIGLAGEKAEKLTGGTFPGTFRVMLFDCVYGMTPEQILAEGKITCM